MRSVFQICVSCVFSASAALAQGAAPVTILPDIEVVAASPVGGAVQSDKLPSLVQSVDAKDFARASSPAATDTIQKAIPGIDITDTQGNSFAPSIEYRGFDASPVQGTPQGLAVYQNGMRLNEAFGDTVNWDLVPSGAINRVDIWTNNPVFGLNALGGAINIKMKNGFNAPGFEATIQGGSFGRVSGAIQYGKQSGDVALFVAIESAREDGWRYNSPSSLTRVYGDLGWKTDRGEIHLVTAAATSGLGVIGPTPLDMIARDERSVFTSPQSTRNNSGFVALNGKFDLSPTWTLEGGVYLRRFVQNHVDGNTGDFEKCSAKSDAPYIGKLCLQDDPFPAPAGGKTPAWRDQFALLDSKGATIPFTAGVNYSTIDRTRLNTTTLGGSAQATNRDKIADHENQFSVGASIDTSWINFMSSTQLGILQPDLTVTVPPGIAGIGSIIRTNGDLGFAPVSLTGRLTYYGLFATDTFNLTPDLALTVGARANIASITTSDASGTAPELNATNTYARVNPMAGLAYKFASWGTVYAGYSEANRAPTPLELDCANPAKPCLLENALVSDPPLKQVVARTVEIGARGQAKFDDMTLDWKLALFNTRSENDIIALSTAIVGRGYYANVPATQRRGLEASARLEKGPWALRASYAFIDATYQFTALLPSANNPFADANGNVQVTPGKQIPGTPRHRAKLGIDYEISPEFKVGADAVIVGPQYYAGDHGNQNPMLPAYWFLNLSASWQATKNAQVFALINNALNRRFATYGAFFDPTGVQPVIAYPLTDPRVQTLAPPLSAQIGVKVTF